MREYDVSFYGSTYVVFHNTTDQRVNLSYVAVVSGIVFCLFFSYAMQAVCPITLDYRGVHLMGDGYFFPVAMQDRICMLLRWMIFLRVVL